MEGSSPVHSSSPVEAKQPIGVATITCIPSRLIPVSAVTNTTLDAMTSPALPFLNPARPQSYFAPVTLADALITPLSLSSETAVKAEAIDLTQPPSVGVAAGDSASDSELYRPGPSGYQPAVASKRTTECVVASDDSEPGREEVSVEDLYQISLIQPSPKKKSGSPKLVTELLFSRDVNDSDFQRRWWTMQYHLGAYRTGYRFLKLDLDESTSEDSVGTSPTDMGLSFAENAADDILLYLEPFNPEETDQRFIVLMAIYNMEVINKTKFGLKYKDLKGQITKMNQRIDHKVSRTEFSAIIEELKGLNLVTYSLHLENIELTERGREGLKKLMYMQQL